MTPAANALAPIGQAIEAAYLAFEPYVQYGFQLLEYAVRYLPWIGWLAPQITFLYNLFEPIVQAALFNTIDVLTQTIGLSQGLSNFWAATTASINHFIRSEAYWFLSASCRRCRRCRRSSRNPARQLVEAAEWPRRHSSQAGGATPSTISSSAP